MGCLLQGFFSVPYVRPWSASLEQQGDQVKLELTVQFAFLSRAPTVL